VPLALSPTRIVKSLKEFHQGELGFHAGVLMRRASDVIYHIGWI